MDFQVCQPQKCQEPEYLSGKHLALYNLSGLPLRLSPLTENTPMITVSRCGVKLQEVLSGLEKKAKTLDMCTFLAFLNIHSFIHYLFFFLSTWV